MEQPEYRLSVVMFTDIAGYNRMISLDEGDAVKKLHYYQESVNRLSRAHGGQVVKSAGDTLLIEFSSALGAMKCGLAIQAEMSGYNGKSDSDSELPVRIGLHLGENYFFGNDAVGEGINIAARLQSVTGPGRICISRAIYDLVSGRLPGECVHIGAIQGEGIERPVEAFEFLPESAATGPVRERTATGAAESEADYTPEDEEELKKLVFAELKKAGRRLSISEIRALLPARSGNVERVLSELARKGFLTRLERDDGSTDYAAASYGNAPGHRPPHRRGVGDEKEDREAEKAWDRALDSAQEMSYEYGLDPLVEDYREQTAHSVIQARARFRAHLSSFVGANGMLFTIWLLTGGIGTFPWFLIPFLAWGIGMASHAESVRQKKLENDELEALPDLKREELRDFRKLTRARGSWRAHLVSNGATGLFLFVLNMITSPAFPWFLFPVGGMAIGLFSHYPAYRYKRQKLLDRLSGKGSLLPEESGRRQARRLRRRRLGASRNAQRAGGERAPSPAGGAVGQAERGERAILRQLSTFKKGENPLGEDFEEVLGAYVSQVAELAEKSAELDQIMHSIPLAALERDLVQLREKRKRTENDRVAAEYDRSIAQIEKQKRSFAELQAEQEMLNLRVSSALNALKQIQIDLARMKNLASFEGAASVANLKERSEELSRYLEDLRKGYEELG